MSRTEYNRIEYIIALLAEFAERFKISQKDACNYLLQHKGMDYVLKFYDVLHTLSFDEVINDVATICARNGGNIEYGK